MNLYKTLSIGDFRSSINEIIERKKDKIKKIQMVLDDDGNVEFFLTLDNKKIFAVMKIFNYDE